MTLNGKYQISLLCVKGREVFDLCLVTKVCPLLNLESFKFLKQRIVTSNLSTVPCPFFNKCETLHFYFC